MFGLLLLHGQRVGVVRTGRLQPHEALLGVELLHLLVGLLGGHLGAPLDLVIDEQRRAHVLPVKVHLAVQLRATQHGAAHAVALVDLVALVLQVAGRHLGQDQLLGEVLAADDDFLGGLRRRRAQADGRRRGEG